MPRWDTHYTVALNADPGATLWYIVSESFPGRFALLRAAGRFILGDHFIPLFLRSGCAPLCIGVCLKIGFCIDNFFSELAESRTFTENAPFLQGTRAQIAQFLCGALGVMEYVCHTDSLSGDG